MDYNKYKSLIEKLETEESERQLRRFNEAKIKREVAENEFASAVDEIKKFYQLIDGKPTAIHIFDKWCEKHGYDERKQMFNGVRIYADFSHMTVFVWCDKYDCNKCHIDKDELKKESWAQPSDYCTDGNEILMYVNAINKMTVSIHKFMEELDNGDFEIMLKESTIDIKEHI